MQEISRILIADDHPVFIDGFINVLAAHPGYQVIATAASSAEVFEKLSACAPHIALLDVNMPGSNGLELVKQIRQKWPEIRIILITMYMPADLGIRKNEEGVDGYVLKNSGKKVILAALEEVKNGGRYWDPNLQSSNHHSEDIFPRQLRLSSREKEILEMIRAGQTNKEIAGHLFLSELTIKTHRKNIMKKLGARNLAELLRS